MGYLCYTGFVHHLFSPSLLVLVSGIDILRLFVELNSLNMYMQYEYSLFLDMISAKAVL